MLISAKDLKSDDERSSAKGKWERKYKCAGGATEGWELADSLSAEGVVRGEPVK
jgi:hypothetical protein